jgi:polyisoprenoid-binding protein YceI
MKKFAFLLLFAAAAAGLMSRSATQAVNMSFADRYVSAAATGESGKYDFDTAHTFIGFKVKHMGLIDVPGFFRDFKGTINYDAKDVARSTVEFTAKMTSVDTGIAPRDAHLRRDDFFDVEKFPDMTFKSTKVEKKGEQWYMTGNLTMKAVTRSVTMPINITGFLPAGQRDGGTMGVTAQTTINRKDFGVAYDRKLPTGTSAVADDIKIDLQIEAKRALPAPAADTAVSRP